MRAIRWRNGNTVHCARVVPAVAASPQLTCCAVQPEMGSAVCAGLPWALYQTPPDNAHRGTGPGGRGGDVMFYTQQ